MIDHEKIEQAVRLLLEGIGEDVNREGCMKRFMAEWKKMRGFICRRHLQ